MSALKDLTGNKFGRLLVVGRAESHKLPCGQVQTMWSCVCDCGNKTVVNTGNLKSGRVVSCGCFNLEKSHIGHPIHGHSRSRIYNIWAGMKKRCSLESSASYKHYGKRGISVCDEWKESFESFYEWSINNGYNDLLSIDRIDTSGCYEPQNCGWTTMREQQNTRKNNLLLELDGEVHSASEWARISGLKYTTLMRRIERGWDIRRAITEPVGGVKYEK